MKTLLPLFLILLFCLSGFSQNGFKYSSKDISEAEKFAKQSGKSLLIYYRADGCEPCQAMEESTFMDDHLIKEMNDKYVTVAVDRDEIESPEKREKYYVCCLPAFQVLDDSGVAVSMSKGTMKSKELYSFLDIPYSVSPSVLSKMEVRSGWWVNPQKENTISSTFDDKTNHSSSSGIVKKDKKSSYTFQPGRVSVNENTYAEMKARAVKRGVVEEKKETRYEDAASTSVNAGRVGSNEMVKVKEETRKAPSSTIMTETEEDKEEQKRNDKVKVNEEVAKEMIGILNEVEQNNISDDGTKSSELSKSNSSSPELELKKVGANEEVSIKTISREKETSSPEVDKMAYMQAGAFSNYQNAYNLKTKLSMNTSKVKIIESKGKGQNHSKLYKVLLGPIESSTEREDVITILTSIGIEGFAIEI